MSGHLDSWDVGQGAMDDGGGAFISWQALSLIRQLGLRPKRTLRMVMWTAEVFDELFPFLALKYWLKEYCFEYSFLIEYKDFVNILLL